MTRWAPDRREVNPSCLRVDETCAVIAAYVVPRIAWFCEQSDRESNGKCAVMSRAFRRVLLIHLNRFATATLA